MTRDINRADVERRVERLEAEWGPFPVDGRDETWPAGEFEESVALAEGGYTGGGYVLAVREPDQAAPLTESMPDDATQDDDRLLLAMGRDADEWGPPGGGRKSRSELRADRNAGRSGGGRDTREMDETGETYEEAAVREVREETGVDVELTGVDWALRWRTTAEGDDRTVHTLYVVFTGTYSGGSISIQPGELDGAAWFRELPANLHQFAERFADDWAGGRAGSRS